MKRPMQYGTVNPEKRRNYQGTGIPGVLGYVDGTHIAIKAPKEEEHLYFNRKNYHSINAQIVCESDLKISNILSRYPASTHDSFIWTNSGVRQRLMDVWAMGERCWLLVRGDLFGVSQCAVSVIIRV
ncbi:hypothetical protein J437_LFUL017811 [Ladona fulva]|uniref:DDE Tnp4 domain-containing protein n=1 Tax=Ladona fulva TaxID=123851 RepID=A0A8K0KNA5_LADFU|nr:hypothetical protein J437_LFUL017811 [Ladona fulva]